MPRPLWSGSISFGLITIPVSLTSIVRHREVQFHEVHDVDRGRIREQLVCERDGMVVSRDAVARGYVRPNGETIIITDDEIEHFLSSSRRSIDLQSFISITDIDPLYYDRSYAVLSSEEGLKAYSLFRSALEETKTIGIASLVMRGKTTFCILRAVPRGLVLTTLLYGDELLRLPVQSAPRTQLSKRDTVSARQFIEANRGSFNPASTRDRSRERLLAFIGKKRPVRHAAPRVPLLPAKATLQKDFTRLLEESLTGQRRKTLNRHPKKAKRRSKRRAS